MSSALTDFRRDAADSLFHWRKWYLLGTQSIRARYARSRLGQLWLSLSYLITVLSLGLVYSLLWGMKPAEFLPYLAVSHVFWTLIAGCVTEGCYTYIGYESLIKTEYHPHGMFVLIVLTRQVVYFLHNVVVLVPVLLFFPEGFGWTALLAIPGFFLLLLNGYWLAMFTGYICTRFRDIPNVVNSMMQILFFITPIIWPAYKISDERARFLLSEINPFAAVLAVIRDPIFGIVPSFTQYAVAIGFALVGVLITLLMFARGSRRLVYWL